MVYICTLHLSIALIINWFFNSYLMLLTFTFEFDHREKFLGVIVMLRGNVTIYCDWTIFFSPIYQLLIINYLTNNVVQSH